MPLITLFKCQVSRTKWETKPILTSQTTFHQSKERFSQQINNSLWTKIPKGPLDVHSTPSHSWVYATCHHFVSLLSILFWDPHHSYMSLTQWNAREERIALECLYTTNGWPMIRACHHIYFYSFSAVLFWLLFNGSYKLLIFLMEY